MRTMRMPVLFTGLLFGLAALAQVPQRFSYQAVARAANGDPLAGQAVGVQFVLHQGNALGAVVFAETHATTTNAHGLFSLSVGGGTASAGSLSTIDWSAGPYFLEVGLDASSSGSYLSMGTQQLLSVPYALYAGKSNVPDGTEVGQIAHWTGTAWAVDSGLYVHDKRFGIGVTQPDSPLGIKKDKATNACVGFYNEEGQAAWNLRFAGLDTTGFSIHEDTLGGSTSRFYIQPGTGNVGLGTTQPQGALTLRSANPLKVKFQNGDVPTQSDFANLIDSRGFGIVQGQPDSMQYHVMVQQGTGHVGLGTDAPSAPLSIVSREILKTYFQTGDIPSQDDFAFTTDSTGFGFDQGTPTSLTNRMFIAASTGHVGINEKTPDTFLHVSRPESDANSSVALTSGSGLATFGPITKHLVFDHQGLQARQGTTVGNTLALSVSELNIQRLGGDVLFHGDAPSESEKVVVRSDGKVGVGVLLPAEKLHLNGAVVVGNTSNAAPQNGTIRYSTGSGDLEGFVANAWTSLSSKWEKVDNSTTPTASKITYNQANAMVGIGVAQPMSALHVRGVETCDEGSTALLVENPAATTSTDASASRIALDISCSGVWSSNVAAKSIGLVASASGAGNANANLAAVFNGNVVVGGLSSSPAVGTGGTNVLAIQSGAAPSSPPGGSGTPGSAVQLFVSTDVSGVSVLNIMNGDGNVIQLHVQNPLSAPDNTTLNPVYDGGTAAVINNLRTRINELEARLQALGLLN